MAITEFVKQILSKIQTCKRSVKKSQDRVNNGEKLEKNIFRTLSLLEEPKHLILKKKNNDW